MADLIRKMQEGHTVEDLDTVIDEVYEARGEYDSLDERLDDMSSGTPAPASSTPSMDGTGSAGTSDQYARADHVHPSDTSKQNALSSTQLDAVNSGIDSEKVDQIETNKNNISTLYKTNVVNLVNIADATTPNTGYQADTALNLPAGEYVVSYELTTTGNFAVGITINGAERVLGDSNPPYSNTKISHTFTATTGVTRFRAYFNGGGTIANIMICKKAAYDAVSGEYQLYAMSNAEITAWILSQT